MTFARIASGKKGEEVATSYLKKQGYKILERNYRTKLGEIDIIGSDGGSITFIEVRSINDFSFTLPEDTINKKKELQITRVALAYIKRYKLEEKSSRFDVICIENVDSAKPKIRLIKNAFELDNRYRY